MSSIKKESPFQKFASGMLRFPFICICKAKKFSVFMDPSFMRQSWDEWVTDRRMYKYDEAGLRKQKELEKLAKSGKKMKILRKSDLKNQPYPPPELIEKVEKAIRPEENVKAGRTASIPTATPEETPSEHPASETSDGEQPPPKTSRQSSVPDEKPPKPTPTPGTNRKKKGRSGIAEITGETEEGFLSRPRIQVNFPENIRAWLVDDWDLITKQSRLSSYGRQIWRGYFIEHLMFSGLVLWFDFFKLRDLITFVKVDQGSLSLLESLVADFISFLERNQDEYFRLEDYTMATADYLRLAMC
ncbi:unnamed protein product [Dibothriocephalus latus]|uniref:MRG domain-containing protein n=1 Tax=Dibothriocephalus latus TaxID=60516 RepID=A0A3P7NM71_DIBLA|nr:unnamed protein product [Dibothriocephalus latus]